VIAKGARACEIREIEINSHRAQAYFENAWHGYSLNRPRSSNFQLLNDQNGSNCGIPGYGPISTDRNDADTARRAAAGRVARDLPQPEPALLARLKIFVADWLTTNLPRNRIMTFWEWLDRSPYNEVEKLALIHAYNTNKRAPPPDHILHLAKSFPKLEAYPSYKNERLINGRHLRVLVFAGPLAKTIEDVLYLQPEYVKHLTPSERATRVAALQSAGFVYSGTDFTAFESSMTPIVQDALEHQLYRHVLRDSTYLDTFIQLHAGLNRIRGRSVKLDIPGGRMSGDATTSVANSFTNHMLNAFWAHEHGYGATCRMLIEGDDALIAAPAAPDPAFYARLGFTLKVDVHQNPTEASFCGLIFASEGQVIRDPRVFFMKFGWSSACIGAGPRVRMQLLRAKALSAVYETPNCPIVGALARRGLLLSEGYAPRFVRDRYHPHPPSDLRAPAFQPTHQTRLLFARLYHISIALQLEVERLIQAGNMAQVAALLPAPADSLHYVSRYIAIT